MRGYRSSSSNPLHRGRGYAASSTGYIGRERVREVPAGVREFEALLASARYTPAGRPWYDASRDCPRPSHNDLFGGTYAVQDGSPDAESTFHGSLVQALREGGVYGLSENRTRWSALYFDLDFCGEPAPVDVPALRGLVGLIREVVVRLAGRGAEEGWPAGGPAGRVASERDPGGVQSRRDSEGEWRAASSAIIATAPPVRVVAAEGGGGAGAAGEVVHWKTGAHIIFPDVVLDRAAMVRVAEAARDHVERTLGPRPAPCNSWAEVFDVGVYRAGLRMLLVDKAGPCPHCHGVGASSGAPPLPACVAARCRRGKVPMRRPYRPVAYVRGEDGVDDPAALHVLLCNPVLALKRASIRRPNAAGPSPTTPRFDDDAMFSAEPPPHGLPVPTPARGVAATSAQGKAALAALLGPPPGPPSSHGSRSGAPGVHRAVVLPSDPRTRMLEAAVREYCPDGRFARLHVRSATVNASGTVYGVQVVGEGHRSCLNCHPGKVHSRAAVHFVVDAELGVSQRCTSRSDKVDRATGRACREFAGPWRRLREELARGLFASAMELSGPLPLTIEGGRVWLPPGAVVDASELDEEDEDERDGSPASAARGPRGLRGNGNGTGDGDGDGGGAAGPASEEDEDEWDSASVAGARAASVSSRGGGVGGGGGGGGGGLWRASSSHASAAGGRAAGSVVGGRSVDLDGGARRPLVRLHVVEAQQAAGDGGSGGVEEASGKAVRVENAQVLRPLPESSAAVAAALAPPGRDLAEMLSHARSDVYGPRRLDASVAVPASWKIGTRLSGGPQRAESLHSAKRLAPQPAPEAAPDLSRRRVGPQ